MAFVYQFVYKFVDSPLGKLTIVARASQLVAVLWGNDRPHRVRLGEMAQQDDDATLLEVERQLNAYFKGQRERFDLPLEFNGTEFQKQVWQALLHIPYGQTRSYLDIATAIGNKKAVRAVGAAIGRNPISIIVPCHRVIGASGALTGFAGGLEAKALLLSLEKKEANLF